MNGEVILAYYNKDLLLDSLSSPNMVVDKAGELIVDALTISPSLSAIPSASAQLDASNFTIVAMSFGKDAAGYGYHAHALTFSSQTDSDGIVRVLSTQTTVSSYNVSAQTISRYNQKPSYPSPLDERLEASSTRSSRYNDLLADAQYITDKGHNLNVYSPTQSWTSPTLRAYIGTFAPSGGVTYYILSSTASPNSPIVSGSYSGTYNRQGVMDGNGYLRLQVTSAAQGNQLFNAGTYSGLLLTCSANFSSTGKVTYFTQVSGGDLGLNNLFGGIFHLGLWALDMRSMVRRGLRPPYNFKDLNSVLDYKLFAKKTFIKDITYVQDNGVSSGARFLGGQIGPGTDNKLNITWRIGLL